MHCRSIRVRVLIGAAFLLLLMPLTELRAVSVSAYAGDCTNFINDGLLDTTDAISDESAWHEAQHFLEQDTATNASQAEQDAESDDMDILGFLGLSFNGVSARNDYTAWKQSFLESNYDEWASSSSYADATRTFSTNLAQVIIACLKTEQPGMAVVAVVQDDTEVVDIKVYSYDNVTGKIHITGGSCQGFANGDSINVTYAGQQFACTRDVAASLSVTVIGNNGESATATAPPFNPVHFSATSTSISPGQSVTLSWIINGSLSDQLSANGGTGMAEPPVSSLQVSPASTTTYTITATLPQGQTQSSSVQVTVTSAQCDTQPIFAVYGGHLATGYENGLGTVPGASLNWWPPFGLIPNATYNVVNVVDSQTQNPGPVGMLLTYGGNYFQGDETASYPPDGVSTQFTLSDPLQEPHHLVFPEFTYPGGSGAGLVYVQRVCSVNAPTVQAKAAVAAIFRMYSSRLGLEEYRPFSEHFWGPVLTRYLARASSRERSAVALRFDPFRIVVELGASVRYGATLSRGNAAWQAITAVVPPPAAPRFFVIKLWKGATGWRVIDVFVGKTSLSEYLSTR